MSPDDIKAGVAGVGLTAALLWNGWQSVQSKREAREAKHSTQGVQRSLSTNNGGSHVKDTLDKIVGLAIEARDAATRAEDKIDRHIEAHAGAHLANGSPVVVLKETVTQ